MSLRIEYDQYKNTFFLTGLWDRPLPFTLNVNYTVNQPVNEKARVAGSPFKTVKNGWQTTTPEINFSLLWEPSGSGIEIRIKLINRLDQPLTLHNINPAILELEDYRDDLENMRFYQHGFQSWTPSRSVRADGLQQYPRLKSFALMNQNVDSPYWGRRDGIISNLFTVIEGCPGQPTFLFGFTDQKSGLGEIFFRNRGIVQLITFLDYSTKLLPPGGELVSEPLWIAAGDPDQLMSFYIQRLAQQMEGRAGGSSPVGWCSWYEFYTAISEQKLLANTRLLADQRDLGLSFVQLDDGYQTAVGDWLSLNQKFPAGLQKITAEIHQQGFKAGIWLAPFLATRNSQLFKEKPGWFLKDRRGKPVDCGYNPMWKSRTAALDLTNPEVEDWLRTVFRQLVDWGFDYFKIDFIFAGIRHGRRTRPEYSPVEAYRHGLTIIRETIGDRFLLGCGAPIGPSVGLVDALRVSEDVLEKWHNPLWEWLGRGCGVPSASGSLRNNIQRHYFHKKLWLNDPDCLLVRDRNSKLKPAEVRTLVTLLGLTGGMLFLSDDLTRLEPERLEWAKAVLPPTDLTGAPQGQFQNEYPELFRVKGRSAQILAITNWHKRSRIFDLAEYVKPGHFIFDFWGERFWKPASAKLLPHATLACQVTAFSGTPQVVGTTLHLTALADERLSQKFDGDKNLLFIKNEKLARATGKIWISVPTGYVYFGAELDGQIQTIESWEQGIVIAIDQSAPWQLTVKFIESPG